MRRNRLRDTLSFRVSERMRMEIEALAGDDYTIGETARDLLELGLGVKAAGGSAVVS